MTQKTPKSADQARRVVSECFGSGVIIETVYDVNTKQTALAYLKDGKIIVAATYKTPGEGKLEPIHHVTYHQNQ